MKAQSQIITNENVPDKSRVGYARVSTADQNKARQLEAFKGLNLYKKDFSRLARSTKDLLNIIETLSSRKI